MQVSVQESMMSNEINGTGIDLIGLPSRRENQQTLVTTSSARTGRMARWANRPLCTRYLVVNFGFQTAALSDGGEFRTLSFFWALGTLNDGEREILGWWQASETDPLRWSAISTDLTARGVQHIRVLADSSGELRSPVGVDGPGFSGSGSDTHSMSAAQQRRVAEAGILQLTTWMEGW
jgi:hypothetical protein